MSILSNTVTSQIYIERGSFFLLLEMITVQIGLGLQDGGHVDGEEVVYRG